MPDAKTHAKINRLMLGKDYLWVSALMDKPAAYLGPSHRRVFHDQDTAFLIFLRSGGDVKALMAAELHIAADREYTQAKRALNKMFGAKSFKERKRR